MSSGIFGISVSGLHAAQTALATASHNIANAGTPGFHRQEMVQTSNVPQYTGEGYVGRGVSVDAVRRVYSQFLESQLQGAENQSAYYDKFLSRIRQLDSVLAGSGTGLAPALEQFFAGANQVAADPSSVPARQTLLSSAALVAGRFRSLDSTIEELRTALNGEIRSSVDNINSLATRIAQLNRSIVLSPSSSAERLPNDLLDQREALIAELNRETRVSALAQADGTVSVFLGTGQPLVLGQDAFSLTAERSAEDASRTVVGYSTGGAAMVVAESSLATGNLGALLDFRSQILDPAQNRLGRIAVAFASAVNDQHRLGQDLNGADGGLLFSAATVTVTARSGSTGPSPQVDIVDAGLLAASDYRLTYTDAAGSYTLTRLSDGTTIASAATEGLAITPQLPSVAGDSFLLQPVRHGARDLSLLISHPALIAAAAPIRTAAALANTGTGTIDAGSVSGPPPLDADVRQPVTITFTGPGAFDVSGTGTGNPAGVAYTAGGEISYNGWTVRISGVPAAGDVFTVTPNSGGRGDNRNAAAIAALQTASLLDDGTASLSQAYGQIVSQVGSSSREAQVNGAAMQSLAGAAREAQQALSGVNLDEEAAALIRYQQAYQASGKALQIATSLFQTLLDLGR